MNNDAYMKLVQDFIALCEEDERYAWFHQEGATAHMVEIMMDVLTKFFEDRIISKGRRLARSPDLTPPDFFLGVFKK